MLPLNRCSKQSLAGIRGSGFYFLMIFTLCTFVGCGGNNTEEKKMGTVAGKVTLKGKPVTDCRINFTSPKSGVGVGADLKEDGSYTMEGPVPVGDYKVFITPPLDFTPAKAQEKSGLDAVPAKYRDEANSGLTAKVKEGESEINFDLK